MEEISCSVYNRFKSTINLGKEKTISSNKIEVFRVSAIILSTKLVALRHWDPSLYYNKRQGLRLCFKQSKIANKGWDGLKTYF